MTPAEYRERHPDDVTLTSEQYERFIQDTIEKFEAIMDIEFNRAELDILEEEGKIRL